MHDFWLYCSIRWLFYICKTLNGTEQTAYFAHLAFVHKRNVCSVRKCEVFVSGQNPCSLLVSALPLSPRALSWAHTPPPRVCAISRSFPLPHDFLEANLVVWEVHGITVTRNLQVFLVNLERVPFPLTWSSLVFHRLAFISVL